MWFKLISIIQIPGVPIMYITKHKYSIERLPEATMGGGRLDIPSCRYNIKYYSLFICLIYVCILVQLQDFRNENKNHSAEKELLQSSWYQVLTRFHVPDVLCVETNVANSSDITCAAALFACKPQHISFLNYINNMSCLTYWCRV